MCDNFNLSCIYHACCSHDRNRGGKKKRTRKIEKDPETAAQGCSAPVGGGEMQVTRRLQRSVDLASVASEMGFVVLIPDVVQSWEKRRQRMIRLRENWRDTVLIRKVYVATERVQCDKHTLDALMGFPLLLYVYYRFMSMTVMTLFMIFMMSLHSSIYQLIVCDIMA